MLNFNQEFPRVDICKIGLDSKRTPLIQMFIDEPAGLLISVFLLFTEIIPKAFAFFAISSELMIGIWPFKISEAEVVFPIPFGPAIT